MSPATVVVTPNEVNSCHGTGILVKRLLGDLSSVVSLCTTDTYTGGQELGYFQYKLPRMGLARGQIFLWVSRLLRSLPVERVVCVPYFTDDLLVALAVKEVFDVPLGIYIMDDQNVYRQSIPDALMTEAVKKSSLRLAISPEMQWAYQNKYYERFWFFPPLVPAGIICRHESSVPISEPPFKGILIGNIWSQNWLDALRRTISGAEVEIDWYCNQRSSGALAFDDDEVEKEGIRYHNPLPEKDLARVASEYQFAVIPTSTGDDEDSAEPLAQYSLPSRVPFVVATSQTPILVLGRSDTCVAHIVERFGVGTTCPYEPASFAGAVARLADPETQKCMRANAMKTGAAFSDEQMSKWFLQSVDQGEPVDQRFEDLMPPTPGTFLHHCDSATPDDVIAGFVPVYRALRRLKRLEFVPTYVVDVGASTGIWSHTVAKLFPEARYLLVDPLASRYDPWRINIPGDVTWIEAAVADRPGAAQMKVSDDLYNSSLLHVSEAASVVETVEVPVTTLDDLAAEHQLTDVGLDKIDVQYAEHLVIAGARTMLATEVGVVVMELTLERADGESKTLLEMLKVMDELGFSYWDDGGEWRGRITGALEQKDIVFIRKGLLKHPS